MDQSHPGERREGTEGLLGDVPHSLAHQGLLHGLLQVVVHAGDDMSLEACQDLEGGS